jgi:hypothetical protein
MLCMLGGTTGEFLFYYSFEFTLLLISQYTLDLWSLIYDCRLLLWLICVLKVVGWFNHGRSDTINSCIGCIINLSVFALPDSGVKSSTSASGPDFIFRSSVSSLHGTSISIDRRFMATEGRRRRRWCAVRGPPQVFVEPCYFQADALRLAFVQPVRD